MHLKGSQQILSERDEMRREGEEGQMWRKGLGGVVRRLRRGEKVEEGGEG